MPGASVTNSGGGRRLVVEARRRASEPNGAAGSGGGGGSGGGSTPPANSNSHNNSGCSSASVNGIGGGGAARGSSVGIKREVHAGAHQGMSSAVVKMKAEVFEKDRDNFLSAFEKPTQIYRFLRARMVESPIFLQRNLSYMRERMSRSHKSRIGFRVDKMMEWKEKDKLRSHNLGPRAGLGTFHNKNSAVNFYNILIMGVADGQIWYPDTKARIDICLIRLGINKRKDGVGPIAKVFEKCVDLKVHSPSSPKSSQEVCIPLPPKVPVISIPADLCTLGTNGHTVRSYKLIVRVTIPQLCLLSKLKSEQTNHLNSRNNNNSSSSDGSEEPKAKRRRSAPATKDRENFIYDGDNSAKGGNGGGANSGGGIGGGDGNVVEELVIYSGTITLYENDIPGERIREADFDVTLKRATRSAGSRISFQRIRKETSFETIDEKHAKVLEQAKPAGKCAKVCLAVRTSSDKPSQLVEPPPPLLSAAIKNENGASGDSGSLSLARLEMRQSVRVIYHFLYGSNSQQQTESRDDLRCPWCSLNCLQLYSLMKHLKLCHPRYNFHYSPIAHGAKIDVSINDSYDGSYSGSAYDLVCQPPGEAFARNGPTKRTEVFSILVCRPKPGRHSLQEFFDCDEKDMDQRRTYITGHNRLYHHTSTCLPIHPREIDVDSEGEPDPEWLRVKTTMMIDEFTDVNEGEKELMKLWNLHVMKYNYVGDCQIPLSCKRFVELHGKELIQKNLYRNFCLHLTNLFDFGLLTPQGVHDTTQLLHSQMKETNTAPANLIAMREGWRSSQGNKGGVNGSASQSPAKSFTSAPSTSTPAAGAGPPSSHTTNNSKTGTINTATAATGNNNHLNLFAVGSGSSPTTNSNSNANTASNSNSNASSSSVNGKNYNRKLVDGNNSKLTKMGTATPATTAPARHSSSN